MKWTTISRKPPPSPSVCGNSPCFTPPQRFTSGAVTVYRPLIVASFAPRSSADFRGAKGDHHAQIPCKRNSPQRFQQCGPASTAEKTHIPIPEPLERNCHVSKNLDPHRR